MIYLINASMAVSMVQHQCWYESDLKTSLNVSICKMSCLPSFKIPIWYLRLSAVVWWDFVRQFRSPSCYLRSTACYHIRSTSPIIESWVADTGKFYGQQLSHVRVVWCGFSLKLLYVSMPLRVAFPLTNSSLPFASVLVWLTVITWIMCSTSEWGEAALPMNIDNFPWKSFPGQSTEGFCRNIFQKMVISPVQNVVCHQIPSHHNVVWLLPCEAAT